MPISDDARKQINDTVAETIKASYNLALNSAIEIIQDESKRLDDCPPQFVAEIIINRIQAELVK